MFAQVTYFCYAADGGYDLQIWKAIANILNKLSLAANTGSSLLGGLGVEI
jgi:hypothetical protein